jgi:SAM-dependent methyltransferase
MHVNYEYVLNFIRNHSKDSSLSLDYGCGKAEIIVAGRKEELSIFGADIFYKGGERKNEVKKLGLLGSMVREIQNNRIDFPDNYFDLIVSNQVLEHVVDFDIVLSEMNRVLKPGGIILSIFPSKEVWREGHCGIPFLHKFPKGGPLRIYYTFILRSFGMGYNKGAKSKWEWSREWCNYIDNYTHYRTKKIIIENFKKYFANISFCEYNYILFRLKHNRSILYPLFKFLLKITLFKFFINIIVRRIGSMVFVVKKV